VQVLLMGTGAADGVPGFFSTSRVSEYARRVGGKDVRSRSSALVDRVLKIDFGPDTWAQSQALGLRPSDWQAILITHSHEDHFAPAELQYLFPPFGEGINLPTVYASESVCQQLERSFEKASWIPRVPLKPFQTVPIGDYEVTPVRATHQVDEESFNYLIRRDRTLLYAVDTGMYGEETWDFLSAQGIDILIVECTEGLKGRRYELHLNAEQVVEMVQRLQKMGALTPGSRICTTHHGHSGDATHEELEAFFAPYGIEVGYDGKVIEL
jgi:phosphoribosyl 1,2-cyclic phosphate phosphodiesterase